MFSLFKKIAENLNGAGVYGDVGLAIFGLVFAVAIWFALKVSKQYISEMEGLPLNDTPEN